MPIFAPTGQRSNNTVEQTMPQSLSRIHLHLVFSTKHRHPFLVDEAVRKELFAVMASNLQDIECPPMLINGAADHVHVLCGLSRKIAVMDLVESVKKETSKWIKTKGARYHDFYWQAGYGVFSVSESNVEQVLRYIESQEEHHRRLSYQDEFRALCAKHGLVIDERYVWD
jgi:REP element-mobilizing transposase RayT